MASDSLTLRTLHQTRIALIFFGFWAVLLFICSAITAHKATLLGRDGVTLTAEVIEVDHVRSHRYSYSEITVQFVPPGLVRPHVTKARTSRTFGRTLQVGGQIAVRVLPGVWDYIAIEPGRLNRISRNVAIGGLALLGFAGFITLGTGRRLHRSDQLARNGVATVGRVQSIDPERSGAVQRLLRWSFETPDGRRHRVKSLVYSGSRLAMLPRGETFSARFDPADPGNAAPDDV